MRARGGCDVVLYFPQVFVETVIILIRHDYILGVDYNVARNHNTPSHASGVVKEHPAASHIVNRFWLRNAKIIIRCVLARRDRRGSLIRGH